MPLMNGVQLVIQVQQTGSSFSCEARNGLPLVNPVYIAFCHVGSAAAQRDMNQLVSAFRHELSNVAGGVPVTPPCGGGGGVLGCHALNEPDCQKLLVLVGDAVTAVPALPMLGMWRSDPSFSVLPAIQRPRSRS
jgi:hypothetical protein